jgi:hypothetical protein
MVELPEEEGTVGSSLKEKVALPPTSQALPPFPASAFTGYLSGPLATFVLELNVRQSRYF